MPHGIEASSRTSAIWERRRALLRFPGETLAPTATIVSFVPTARKQPWSSVFCLARRQEEKLLLLRISLKTATIAQRLCSADLFKRLPRFVVAMRPIQFDPFGEPVVQSDETSRPSATSRIVLRSGVVVFWVLVIGIVTARAAYFDPAFAEKFGGVASLIGHLKAIVGA